MAYPSNMVTFGSLAKKLPAVVLKDSHTKQKMIRSVLNYNPRKRYFLTGKVLSTYHLITPSDQQLNAIWCEAPKRHIKLGCRKAVLWIDKGSGDLNYWAGQSLRSTHFTLGEDSKIENETTQVAKIRKSVPPMERGIWLFKVCQWTVIISFDNLQKRVDAI